MRVTGVIEREDDCVGDALDAPVDVVGHDLADRGQHLVQLRPDRRRVLRLLRLQRVGARPLGQEVARGVQHGDQAQAKQARW